MEIYKQCDSHLHELRPHLQWDYFSGAAESKFATHWDGARELHKELWNWLWIHAVELDGKLYLTRMGTADMAPVTVLDMAALPIDVVNDDVAPSG